MRIDCCELVLASSRFCLRKRRLTTSMDSADGCGAIGGSLSRAICAGRCGEDNYSRGVADASLSELEADVPRRCFRLVIVISRNIGALFTLATGALVAGTG